MQNTEIKLTEVDSRTVSHLSPELNYLIEYNE